MKRRDVIKSGLALAAGTTLAAPAIAQSAPSIRWRLTSSFPKSLDTLYGACEMFSRAIAELSDQKFQIGVFGPGEIVRWSLASYEALAGARAMSAPSSRSIK